MPRARVFGVEVPIPGTDSMQWIELAVSSTYDPSVTPIASPPSHDCSSCSTLLQPPRHIVWRIHKSKPRILELIEFAANEEFSGVGLRISFPESLFSRACVCENKGNLRFPYFLYVMTVSGVAYLLKMRNISYYESCAVFPPEDLRDYCIRSFLDQAMITSVAASLGCFLVGRSDGTVLSFQLGIVDPGSPEFIHEMRDDARFGRLWGLVSRPKDQGPVQDMLVIKISGMSFLFVLHLDGYIRAWDLSNYTRYLCHFLNVSNSSGSSYVKLWIGEEERNIGELPIAILCRNDVSGPFESIYSSRVYFPPVGTTSFSVGPIKQLLTSDNCRCIDVKVTLHRLYVLKDKGLTVYALAPSSYSTGDIRYRLQEEYIEDNLFQLSKHSLDGLSLAIHSAVSSDRVASYISSVILRKLLHSAIYHQAAMRSTLLHYERHFGDAEFQALTLEGLKNEICSIVEREDIRGNSSLLLANWNIFCRCYLRYWRETNYLSGLVVDSSANVVGVIRTSSLSGFRELEPVEQLFEGINGDIDDSLPSSSENLVENELTIEVLGCMENMSSHWGKSAPIIFYESVVCMPIDLTKNIFTYLTNMLENSCSCLHTSYLLDNSNDFSREKKISRHKRLRKFSVDIILRLNTLAKKASSWSILLSSIESFLQFLVPRKLTQKLLLKFKMNVNSTICVQALSQISKFMFEKSIDIFLFASYLCKIGRQIQMTDADISRVQLELCPMIQEIILDWLVIDFLCTTSSEPLSLNDFNHQLSSLQIENVPARQSWRERFGKYDFKLVHIVLLTNEISTQQQHILSSNNFLSVCSVLNFAQELFGNLLWGNNGDEAAPFFKRSVDIALVLFRHSQFVAVENLLKIIEANYQRNKAYSKFQDMEGDWCVLQHMLGCCFLAQARHELNGALKERKINDSIRCFFRASSGKCAPEAFISISCDAGLPTFDFDINSTDIWKLQYYQWAMQLFEQYEFSEGASLFALAALEEVDGAYVRTVETGQSDSIISVKGCLWTNVFKFMLDLKHFEDAYCALLTNPDEESKNICLRRFIVVLFECGAMKVLCDGKFTFMGLAEKIEQELAWKAERSNVLSNPSPYKLLYALEMQRHNWRNAASYMIHYSRRLRMEAVSKDNQSRSSIFSEILNAISTAINALNLVHSQNAWIDLPPSKNDILNNHYPIKKFKGSNDAHGSKVPQYYVSIEDLENEFVLTSAEFLLSTTNFEWKSDGQHAPSVLIDFLVEANLYDMALTVIMKLWKGSSLAKELERFFSAMSLQYSISNVTSSNSRIQRSPNSDMVVYKSRGSVPSPSPLLRMNIDWDTLELYLKKCERLHSGLPVTVAETLLRADPHMELPLWLVHLFKSSEKSTAWGMAGQPANPASLLRLFVKYGRYAEATNLLMEYVDSYASAKPSDLYHRKKPFSSWFPYTVVQRLWAQLDDLVKGGQVVDQCEKLKRLLHAALENHLRLLKVDGEDALASAAG